VSLSNKKNALRHWLMTLRSPPALESQEDHEDAGTAAGTLSVALLDVHTGSLNLFMRTTAHASGEDNMAPSADVQVCAAACDNEHTSGSNADAGMHENLRDTRCV